MSAAGHAEARGTRLGRAWAVDSALWSLPGVSGLAEAHVLATVSRGPTAGSRRPGGAAGCPGRGCGRSELVAGLAPLFSDEVIDRRLRHLCRTGILVKAAGEAGTVRFRLADEATPAENGLTSRKIVAFEWLVAGRERSRTTATECHVLSQLLRLAGKLPETERVLYLDEETRAGEKAGDHAGHGWVGTSASRLVQELGGLVSEREVLGALDVLRSLGLVRVRARKIRRRRGRHFEYRLAFGKLVEQSLDAGVWPGERVHGLRILGLVTALRSRLALKEHDERRLAGQAAIAVLFPLPCPGELAEFMNATARAATCPRRLRAIARDMHPGFLRFSPVVLGREPAPEEAAALIRRLGGQAAAALVLSSAVALGWRHGSLDHLPGFDTGVLAELADAAAVIPQVVLEMELGTTAGNLNRLPGQAKPLLAATRPVWHAVALLRAGLPGLAGRLWTQVGNADALADEKQLPGLLTLVGVDSLADLLGLDRALIEHHVRRRECLRGLAKEVLRCAGNHCTSP